MPRSVWKGAISFGLIHVPVSMFPATQDSGVDFDWLDRRSLDPVGYSRVNKRTNKAIEKDDVVKGVKTSDGSYAIIGEDEIKAAYPKATQSIEIETFVKAAEVSFAYLDTPYYLQPDARSAKVYALLRESMKELTQWLSWCHADYAIADTRQFLDGRAETFQKDSEYSFAIIERANDRFVGAAGINQIEKAALRANLGYWLRTSASGRGYATQATKLVARWAFEALGLERIEIVAAAGNVTSQRVAERVGATRETIARNRLRVHGVQHDAVVFSLIPADARAW